MAMINIQPIEKIEKPNETDDGGLDVHSIFPTIQGEGPYVGQPAIFIRLAGCNLQCPLCDTDYTSGRSRMSIPVILSEVWANDTLNHKPLVVITGGEPFRQRNLETLVDKLLQLNRRVQIETNGTMFQPLSFWDYNLTIVCSPKTAKLHPKIERYIDYFKYVIRANDVDIDDGLPVRALDNHVPTRVARPPDRIKKSRVYVQPCDLQDPTANALSLTEAIHSCRRFGYTLCLQTHKIINLP